MRVGRQVIYVKLFRNITMQVPFLERIVLQGLILLVICWRNSKTCCCRSHMFVGCIVDKHVTSDDVVFIGYYVIRVGNIVVVDD